MPDLNIKPGANRIPERVTLDLPKLDQVPTRDARPVACSSRVCSTAPNKMHQCIDARVGYAAEFAIP